MATRKRTARLRVKKDTLRVLSPEQVEHVRGGKHDVPLYVGMGHTHSPNESRYCL